MSKCGMFDLLEIVVDRLLQFLQAVSISPKKVLFCNRWCAYFSLHLLITFGVLFFQRFPDFIVNIGLVFPEYCLICGSILIDFSQFERLPRRPVDLFLSFPLLVPVQIPFE